MSSFPLFSSTIVIIFFLDVDLFNTYKNYETAANINVPIVGKYIADFIDQKIPGHVYIHLIGHSLGAQISGIAARNIKELCGRTIDRISGAFFKTHTHTHRHPIVKKRFIIRYYGNLID